MKLMQTLKTERMAANDVALIDTVDGVTYKLYKANRGVRIAKIDADDNEDEGEIFLDAALIVGKSMRFIGYPRIVASEVSQPTTLVSEPITRIEYYADH